MKIKTECVAMLLAGGQGSRLGVLTHTTAKPAVPFGGKYRIIDFPLSNCKNSGIDTVGVLTQYQPLVLNDYIGSGQPWDLDRIHGGVHVLPPYQQSSGSDWYKGTANAIYQNIPFIERYDPEYVLVLSGDHIYKMDYSIMIDRHKRMGADCTIAVLEVPMEEASRFGIMNTDENGMVYEFEEKPKNPKSNKASMGIYVFSWPVLREYLIADEKDPSSQNDFGKNIIPKMLDDGKVMGTYPFEGYWKDVGTIDSLWEANLDLLNPKMQLDLDDEHWRIYSRSIAGAPHFVSADAEVQNSIVTEGCDISGTVDFSVIFGDVVIEKGAVVHDSIVMPGSVIHSNARVEYAILGERSVIGAGASVGMRPEEAENLDDWGVTVIGPDISVGRGSTVGAHKMIASNVKDGETID
ncbi:MAG: glucose-1-phosphate adenylyltransferase [Firmicutes bacterium]|nr:glucose-1-phosphate adenylyltransferase [Bacillota bacterium]